MADARTAARYDDLPAAITDREHGLALRARLKKLQTSMTQSAKQIGIAVVEHAGGFLVGIRPEGAPLAGLAEFPGGKCAAGESPAACAVRECLEETGLAVAAVELLLRRLHDYPHGRVDLHFWKCRLVDPSAVREDHRGFRWIPAAELPSLEFPEANAEVIQLLMESKPG